MLDTRYHKKSDRMPPTANQIDKRRRKHLRKELPNANYAFVVTCDFNQPLTQRIIIGAGAEELVRGYVQDILDIRNKFSAITDIYEHEGWSFSGKFREGGEQLLTNIIGVRTMFAQLSPIDSSSPIPGTIRMYDPEVDS